MSFKERGAPRRTGAAASRGVKPISGESVQCATTEQNFTDSTPTNFLARRGRLSTSIVNRPATVMSHRSLPDKIRLLFEMALPVVAKTELQHMGVQRVG